MPLARVHSDRLPRNQWLEKELKNIMVGQGFNEVINFSFASPVDSEKLQLVPQDRRRTAVKLLNPLIDEHSVMRTSLLPGLLQTAARNFNVRTVNLRLFEMRRVYLPTTVQELPHEPLHLAGLLAGARAVEGWNQSKEQVDFYDVKGVVETIAAALCLPAVTFQAESVESFYHPGKACSVLVNGDVIGSLGEIHPDVQENFALERPVFYFELDFERLLRHSRQAVAIIPPARFPDILRDIALLVPDDVAAAVILATIRGQKSDRLADVTVFDLYQGANLPEGHRSIAVRLRYSAPDRTLTDDEVNRLHQKIVDNLTAQLPVSIR
jgi:phenylalanyl-tRNA synthetase beta chain